jgi:sulfoacetaldehyde dehydrogenase
MLGEPTVGVVDRDPDLGTHTIAKPVGVVGALTPSTNPVGTPVALAMFAVKGRNPIVISPSPAAEETTREIVAAIQSQLETVEAPPELVQMVDPPITKAKANELLERADLVQVTGSENNVEAGQTVGTPNLCVGEGNVVCLVERTADIESTAEQIAHSAAFDNGLTCLNVNSLIAQHPITPRLIDALEARGGYVCTDEETAKLRATLFEEGTLRTEVVGRSAGELAGIAGLSEAARDASYLLVEPREADTEDPLCGEKLSPVVAVYERRELDRMVDLTNAILEYEGRGHSCVIYTGQPDRAVEVGKRVDVCRLGVNQSSIELAGSFENDLAFTFSLGGGPMAGNQVDENITFEHFVTTTTVSEPIDGEPPADEDLFAPVNTDSTEG